MSKPDPLIITAKIAYIQDFRKVCNADNSMGFGVLKRRLS